MFIHILRILDYPPNAYVGYLYIKKKITNAFRFHGQPQRSRESIIADVILLLIYVVFVFVWKVLRHNFLTRKSTHLNHILLAEISLDEEQWNDGLLATIREKVLLYFSIYFILFFITLKHIVLSVGNG